MEIPRGLGEEVIVECYNVVSLVNCVRGSSGAQERVDFSSSVSLLTIPTPSRRYELVSSPIEPNGSSPIQKEAMMNCLVNKMVNTIPKVFVDTMEVEPEGRSNHMFTLGHPTYWKLPFMQWWLFRHSQAKQHIIGPNDTKVHVLILKVNNVV